MATTLKSVVSFVGVAPGASMTLPHRINIGDSPRTPDEISLSNQTFTAIGDATTITVTNQSDLAADCDVLCEHWHSIKRAFGSAVAHLTPRPFVIGGWHPTGAGSDLREVRVSFDHAFSGAIDFGVLASGESVIGIQLVIDEPFDDPATLVSLGLVSNPDGILSTANVDPNVASTYGAQENLLVTSVDGFRLKVFPFSSTQGAGRVVAIVG